MLPHHLQSCKNIDIIQHMILSLNLCIKTKKEQQSSAESPHLISLFIVWRQEEACFISAKQTKLTLCSALNSAFLSGDGVVVTGFQLFSIFTINNEKFDLRPTNSFSKSR